MKARTNGKQRDRVASYAGGGSGSNGGGGPSSSSSSLLQANQKKKPYRARGCRGGVSRKTKKKQQQQAMQLQMKQQQQQQTTAKNPSAIMKSDSNEENDPSRLNNLKHDGSVFVNASINVDSGKPDTANTIRPDNKMRTLSILPNGSILNVHATAGGGEYDATESNVETELISSSSIHATRSNTGEFRPFLPGHAFQGMIVPAASSAIARPTNATTASSSTASSGGGGFSFFSISPRSFLSGQKKTKASRLH